VGIINKYVRKMKSLLLNTVQYKYKYFYYIYIYFNVYFQEYLGATTSYNHQSDTRLKMEIFHRNFQRHPKPAKLRVEHVQEPTVDTVYMAHKCREVFKLHC